MMGVIFINDPGIFFIAVGIIYYYLYLVNQVILPTTLQWNQ